MKLKQCCLRFASDYLSSPGYQSSGKPGVEHAVLQQRGPTTVYHAESHDPLNLLDRNSARPKDSVNTTFTYPRHSGEIQPNPERDKLLSSPWLHMRAENF